MLKQVTIQDLELLYHIETTCFPIQEAASYQSLKERLAVYHEGFEIFYIDHQAIGYIGGLRNHECIYQIVCTKMLFYIKKMENIK